MCRSLKSPEECDGGGGANKGRSTEGAKCTCQLEFQSLDITGSPFMPTVAPDGRGGTFKNSWHCWSIMSQICIIIRKNWGKLHVIFWLSCQLWCEKGHRFFAKKKKCFFLKISAASSGNSRLGRLLLGNVTQSSDFSKNVVVKIHPDKYNFNPHITPG